MPDKVTLADGTEREVPTADEMTALQTKAAKADELDGTLKTLNTTLGVPEGQTLEEYAQELKESANPNWPKVRAALKQRDAILREKGIEINEAGEITNKPAGVSAEEAKTIAQQTIVEASANTTKSQLLSSITDAGEREVVKTYLDKLMALGGTAEENFDLAYSKAFPERRNDSVRSAMATTGGAPRISSGGQKDYSETEEGKDLAKSIGLSFAQDKK